MHYLTSIQLQSIVTEYLPEHLSRADYAAAIARKGLARAEIARRKTCTVVVVKIVSTEQRDDLASNGWAFGFNSDEDFFFAWKRPNELTKFDRANFLYYYA